jgi:hypothetical protein
MRLLPAILVIALSLSCGGPLPTSGSATGTSAAIAQVRLFDLQGIDLTRHTGLPDDQSVRVQVRLYAPDGHRLTEIVGGVEATLQFTPASLATSAAVPGRPLERVITPTAASGTAGSQMVQLSFPNAAPKTFGPFHVQVESPSSSGAEMRLFDDFNVELTLHLPLFSNDTRRIEVRLYDSTGTRRTSIPGGAEVSLRFEPPSIGVAEPVPGLPFWFDVRPTAPLGTEGSLFIAVVFLATNITKTYGPIQVLVH